MIQGISHLTFVVHDLDRTEQLLVTVLGANKVYDSGDETFSISKERFYQIGDIWLVTMLGEGLPTQTYNHTAFKIAQVEFDRYLAAINAMGLQVRESRPRVAGEGRSIYFYDYDNHLFELHTGTLDERLTRYAAGKAK